MGAGKETCLLRSYIKGDKDFFKCGNDIILIHGNLSILRCTFLLSNVFTATEFPVSVNGKGLCML